MNETLKLEDIEEFEFAGRIPRDAIASTLVEGIRQLNEATELEPFLREILVDCTKTPHTSTEIADVLTHHVTIRGQSRLAAFVNKGKSCVKVTSKEVAHQLLRLRQVRGLELVVLLASGNIHDDAKRDLYQVAEDSNAIPLIIDAVDVARLLVAYQKVCPKDGTPYRAGQCDKCGTSADASIELSLSVREALRYTILSQDDVSTGAMKRYRAVILTDPHYRKDTIREVVKRATAEMRSSRYYRSDLVRDHFGDRDADCVFLFVYVDPLDV